MIQGHLVVMRLIMLGNSFRIISGAEINPEADHFGCCIFLWKGLLRKMQLSTCRTWMRRRRRTEEMNKTIKESSKIYMPINDRTKDKEELQQKETWEKRNMTVFDKQKYKYLCKYGRNWISSTKEMNPMMRKSMPTLIMQPSFRAVGQTHAKW